MQGVGLHMTCLLRVFQKPLLPQSQDNTDVSTMLGAIGVITDNMREGNVLLP